MSPHVMKRAPANLILMYHRVANARPDPWSLCVSPPRFEAQLEYLVEHMEVVALRDIHEPSSSGKPRVAITFDDGYLDNLKEALPRLVARELPATFFIMTGTIGSPREFWWDELDNILLNTDQLPEQFHVNEGSSVFSQSIGQWNDYDDSAREADRHADVMNAEPGTRLHSYLKIWDWLCAREAEERLQLLDGLWSWSGRPAQTRPGYRPMSSEELVGMSQSELVEIGAHTISHPRIPTLSQEEQAREILHSAETLTQITGKRPESFSFPFGQRDSASVALVREAFQRAVLTRPGVITSSTPPHQLNRVAIEDAPPGKFADRLESALAQTHF